MRFRTRATRFSRSCCCEVENAQCGRGARRCLDQVNRVDLAAISETHAVHLIRRHCESRTRIAFRILNPEKCKNATRNKCALYYIYRLAAARTKGCSLALAPLLLSACPRPTLSAHTQPCPMRARPHAGCGMHMHTASPQSPPRPSPYRARPRSPAPCRMHLTAAAPSPLVSDEFRQAISTLRDKGHNKSECRPGHQE